MVSLSSKHEDKSWGEPVLTGRDPDFEGGHCFWIYDEDKDYAMGYIPKRLWFKNHSSFGADFDLKLYWEDGRSNVRRIILKPGEEKIVDCSYRQIVILVPDEINVATIRNKRFPTH